MNQRLQVRDTSVMHRITWLGAILMILFIGACDSSSKEPDPVPLETKMAEDVPADPVSGRDPTTGRPTSNNLYTLYDLDENKVVLSSSDTDTAKRQADSTGTVWDIGFKATTIIFNGGESGPGKASAQILKQPMDEVKEAPASGYVKDGENTECPAIDTPVGPKLAVCTGSNNGWYSYEQGVINPIPGRSIVLQTATGNYAVLRVLSYYKGKPSSPTSETPSRHYTFEFILQTDGSRNLQNTTSN